MANSVSSVPCRGYRWFYVAGKGDWKYKKDWLCEKRHWTQKGGGICRRCLADGTNWMRLDAPIDDSAILTAFADELPMLGIFFGTFLVERFL